MKKTTANFGNQNQGSFVLPNIASESMTPGIYRGGLESKVKNYFLHSGMETDQA